MIMDAESLIKEGCIITQVNFLPNFKELDEKKLILKYYDGLQPKEANYGNRFQAMPVWESDIFDIIDVENHKIIFDKFQTLFDKKIINFTTFIRKTLTSELKKSVHFKNSHYGFIHDDNVQYGAVIPFDQSYTGGTAFFEEVWDKEPDIKFGAYPNRLILFNGKRNHAACHDYTYEERYVLLVFFDIE